MNHLNSSTNIFFKAALSLFFVALNRVPQLIYFIRARLIYYREKARFSRRVFRSRPPLTWFDHLAGDQKAPRNPTPASGRVTRTRAKTHGEFNARAFGHVGSRAAVDVPTASPTVASTGSPPPDGRGHAHTRIVHRRLAHGRRGGVCIVLHERAAAVLRPARGHCHTMTTGRRRGGVRQRVVTPASQRLTRKIVIGGRRTEYNT